MITRTRNLLLGALLALVSGACLFPGPRAPQQLVYLDGPGTLSGQVVRAKNHGSRLAVTLRFENPTDRMLHFELAGVTLGYADTPVPAELSKGGSSEADVRLEPGSEEELALVFYPSRLGLGDVQPGPLTIVVDDIMDASNTLIGPTLRIPFVVN